MSSKADKLAHIHLIYHKRCSYVGKGIRLGIDVLVTNVTKLMEKESGPALESLRSPGQYNKKGFFNKRRHWMGLGRF